MILSPSAQKSCSERGNILFYILIGVVLIGALTVALNTGRDGGKSLDAERLTMTVGKIQNYDTQLQAGVATLLQNGISEADIRFAHPKNNSAYGTITTNPAAQIFHPQGGNVAFQLPPENINDGSKWEIVGNLAIPQAGSNRPELVAILPNVTKQFCEATNRQLNLQQPGTLSCTFLPATRFTGTYATSPLTYAETVFNRAPVMQGCAECSNNTRYYFFVLMTR